MTIPSTTSGETVTVHEVLGGTTADCDDLLALHRQLFPHYAYYQPYMRERAQQPPDAEPGAIEHWWLVRVDGQAAAVRFFKYVPARDCAIALAIGILPRFRPVQPGHSRRFSEAILHASLRQVLDDAAAVRRLPPVGMVTELEAYLRDRYYTEYGYVRLPVAYVEPSFTSSAEAFIADKQRAGGLNYRPLDLCVLPTDPATFDPTNPTLLHTIVLALYLDHYGLPADHAIVRQVLASVPRSPHSEEGHHDDI